MSIFLTEFTTIVSIFKNHILCLQFYAWDDKKNFPHSSLWFHTFHLISSPLLTYSQWCLLLLNLIILQDDLPALYFWILMLGGGGVLTVEARHTPGSRACFRIAANNWNIFHTTQTKSILNSTSLNWVLKMPTVTSHQYTQGGVPTVWVTEEGAGLNRSEWKYFNIAKLANTYDHVRI